MYTRKITYTDYNGNERTEEFMFNLNKSELTMMEMSPEGSYRDRLSKMIDKNDSPTIMRTFRDLLHASYGEKSEDGRRFVKSEAISEAFEQTEAYNILFMELCTDPKKAAEFAQAILPPDLRKAAQNASDKVLYAKSEVVDISQQT